ncbi:MAG: hypothetical protein FWC36_11035 [Spirochaetes bacterium]|nr:hypothetical protein [Spirochaetota bacterium]
MGNVKNLCQELNTIISEINSSAFKIAPASMEKLEKIGADAAELNMKAGKGLIDNLIGVLKSFQAGKSNEDSVSLRLTALEFYIKNILENPADTEEEL